MTSNRIVPSVHLAPKLSALTVAMLLMQSHSALAAPIVVDTINNTADARYAISDTQTVFGVASNTVQLQTANVAQYGISLSGGSQQTVMAGETIVWKNTITNTGYDTVTVDLTFDYPSSLSNFEVYQDLNKNGVIDANDRLITGLDQIKLGRSESLDLLIQAITDKNAADGTRTEIKVGVTVLEDPSITDSVTDSLVVVAPGIRFTDDNYQDNAQNSQISNNVYIETSYAACNVQADKPDEVLVTITSSKTNDTYSLKGVETGNNTGKYRLSAPTQNNANAINDNIIQTLADDTLQAKLVACVSPEGTVNESLISQINIVDNEASLQVKKEGDVKTAELGDYINYSITVTNNGAATAYDVELKDALPRGFEYVKGSVRQRENGIAIDSLTGNEFKTSGKYHVLSLGDMAQGSSREITYRVLVGALAVAGDGVNRAFATANNVGGNNQPTTSRQAEWAVDVSRGAINDKGVIVGKIYHDINRDGIQQKQDNELGVAGVRVYMENGNFAVTDGEGKYNFYGVSAKTHVLKVDTTTLPAGTELITQSNRNAGDAGSAFADVRYGELHRTDFAIVGGFGDAPETLNQVLLERKKTIARKNDALEQAIKSELPLEPDYDIDTSDNVDASGCKANGMIDGNSNCDSAIVLDDRLTANNTPRLTINKIAQPKPVLLDEYLKQVPNNDVAFLNLSANQQLDTHKQLVQVQAPLGAAFTLYVNGKAVSEDHIGKTAEQEKQQVTAFDYYSVELQRGKNTLRGVSTDVTGKVVSEQSVTVIAPDSLQGIDYRTQDALVQADGVSEYQVVVSLKDKNGLPYIGSMPVTIDTTIGTINLPDTSKDQPGTQVIISGGELLVPVTAPNAPGQGELVVNTGSTKKVIPLQFTAKLRPLIAVGIVEGNISLRDFDSSKISDGEGAFEQELHAFSGDDNHTASGRAALFLKGKVRGDYLLTLSFDSDKKGERLFRDIEPGEYYPVYGDASAKGFDAQSTSKLYVRLDKGRSFAMYGDLKTHIDNDEGIELGQYNRTLTGLKAQYEDDNTRVTTFAARTATSQQVNETRGLGISGPYPLGNNFDAVLENSETVEVITRDADNPGLIVKRETLSRFADYEIDPISRSLYLKAPIASQDIDGNPIYLRVTTEVDTNGENYWVGGVAVKQQLNKKVSVGGSYVYSDDPNNQEQLASINSVVHINDKLKLIAEYAKNRAENPDYSASNQINTTELTDTSVKGDALRVELEYDDKKRTKGKAYYHDADTGFVTGASPLTAGRTESGVEVTRILRNQKTALKVEGVYTNEHSTDNTTQGIKATVEQRLTQNVTGEIGMRYYRQDAGGSSRAIQDATDVVNIGDDTAFNDDIINQSALNSNVGITEDIEGVTANARITARLPKLSNALVFAEYEQDINHSSRNATSIGGEAPLGKLGRLYARHDLINSLSGSYGLDDTDERQRTVIGFDANYLKNGKVYSEYRARDAISAREAEAAIGLKNKWQVQEGLTINTLLERIESLEGDTDKTATAAGIGVEYLAKENYKASGRLEKRWGETSDTLLGSAGIAYRYNDDITLLAKDIYSRVDYDDGHRTINRFQVGSAYRDADSNQLDMLTKLEYRFDDNATGEDPYKKDALVWSWSGNYHPSRPWTFSGHYAGKYTEYTADGMTDSNMAHAAYARGLYDISERWDMGLQAGTYWNQQADDFTHMLGAEVGYSPITNLWVSAGYNFMGFKDDDIAYDDDTQEGGYVRLRFKFDENLFKKNDANKNARKANIIAQQ